MIASAARIFQPVQNARPHCGQARDPFRITRPQEGHLNSSGRSANSSGPAAGRRSDSPHTRHFFASAGLNVSQKPQRTCRPNSASASGSSPRATRVRSRRKATAFA